MVLCIKNSFEKIEFSAQTIGDTKKIFLHKTPLLDQIMRDIKIMLRKRIVYPEKIYKLDFGNFVITRIVLLS